MTATRDGLQTSASWRAWAFSALSISCAEITPAGPGALDGGPVVDRAAEEVTVPDAGDASQPDAASREDALGADVTAARAGYTRCRELECDNRDRRCVLCPGFEAVCAPLAGVFRCDREGALIAYCDGDEDCEGARRCEWRMGDTLASMVCVPTNGRACNGFCNGCGSSCQRDADCERTACGMRCVNPSPAGGTWPGFGRCQ